MSLLNPTSYTIKVSAILDVDNGFQDIYTNDDATENAFNKVLIVGLTSDRDDVIFGRNIEDGLNRAYRKEGLFYIPYVVNKPTTLTFKSKLKALSGNWVVKTIDLNIGATVTVETGGETNG